MEELHKNLIYNKRVVIVGSAPYLINKNNGKNIDDYDTVIRINTGHSLTKNTTSIDYGTRTDILYHCLCMDPNNGGLIKKDLINNIKLFVGSIPPFIENEYKYSSFKNGYLHIYNKLPSFIFSKFINISKNEYINLENEIGCRPWTGIIAINNILKYNPKELYITGFTNGVGGNNKNIDKHIDQINYNSYIKILWSSTYFKCHDPYLLFLYTKKILLNNNKIILDKEFIEILKWNIKSKEELYNKYINY